jgi:hypothetical protein
MFLVGMFVGVVVWVVWTYATARFVLWREHRGWTDEPEPVTVTLTLDTRAFADAMKRTATAFANVAPLIGPGITRAVGDWQRSMEKLAASLRTTPAELEPVFARVAAQREVKVAGLCGKYYVRAGLDPKYRDPAMLHLLVQGILGGATHDQLTEDEKRQVAVAAMRGWSEAYQKGAHVPYAAARRYGSAVVTVVAA